MSGKQCRENRIPFVLPPAFVRIRMMLRADPKAVKRRRARKPELPNKNSIAWRWCSQIVQHIVPRGM
jgi:hypothetical protein